MYFRKLFFANSSIKVRFVFHRHETFLGSGQVSADLVTLIYLFVTRSM
jgi:hypothetical protein